MAIVHLSGTKLAPQQIKAPLNRHFMYAMGFIFIIAMHFFLPNPGGSGLAISFNNTTWIAVSIAIGIGLYQTARNHSFRYTKLTTALLICSIILTLPLLYPDANPTAALPRIIGVWAGWLLFAVLQQFSLSNKHKQRLLWLIILAVIIEAGFGYVQLFVLKEGNLFGYNPNSYRPNGIFQQRNVMASFLATGFVLSGYLLARQQQKYGQKLSRTTILYLMPLITLPLVVVIASRTGWLGAGLGFLCVLPYLYSFSTIRRLTGWTLLTAAGVGLGLAISFSSTVTPSGNDNYVQSRVNLESTRETFYPQAIDMFIEKPFTGYGYGRFESEYMLYTARQHQLNGSYPAGLPSLDHPHNEFLYWGVEGGILPLLGILLAGIFILAKLGSVRKGTRLAILGLFVPIAIHTQLEYPFYHSAIHWITFVILLFWLDQRTPKYRIHSFSKLTRLNIRLSSLILPVVTSFIMLTSLHTNYVLTTYEKSEPKDPSILEQVTNTIIWKDRLDWNIYSTYLKLGLVTQDPELIQPYIDWSLNIIREKPREAYYNNLILAYLGIGQTSKAEQIRSEAEFLFPHRDFSDVHLKIVIAGEELPVQTSLSSSE